MLHIDVRRNLRLSKRSSYSLHTSCQKVAQCMETLRESESLTLVPVFVDSVAGQALTLLLSLTLQSHDLNVQ